MALLGEFALTPDVFDVDSYSSQDVLSAHLAALRPFLLNEAVVRNLCDGEWVKLLLAGPRNWHPKTRELINKLRKRSRLASSALVMPHPPSCDQEWCQEAIASHAVKELEGVISTVPIAKAVGDPFVTPIDRVTAASWWTTNSSSIQLARTIGDYETALRPVLDHASSFMVIDPYFDPTQGRFSEFLDVLIDAARRRPSPPIEIHTACRIGSGQHRRVGQPDEFQAMYSRWLPKLRGSDVGISVHVWDEFHDRYLITNLVGISLPYGFDTSPATNTRTTWTRLSPGNRDEVQREFDPASSWHKRRFHFEL